MSSNHSKGLNVITVPVKMKRQIEMAQKMKLKSTKKKVKPDHSRRGNLSEPIITCKNPQFNFYNGQTYNKFEAVSLASQNWDSRKSKGDHFTIHKYMQNPAFAKFEDDSADFDDLGLDEKVTEQLRKCGFKQPTNIQGLAIPHILNGSNTLIAAETGNGKTYAFLAPIIHQILKMKERDNVMNFNTPKALIIVPGRELVTQTRNMARLIGDDLGISINSIIGGRTKRMMLRPRISTPDILVGSFGALSKLTTTGVYKCRKVTHIVLDEADTLLDDSFNEKVTYFLSKFAIRGNATSGDVDDLSGVQLSLVGATFPRSLDKILENIVERDSLVHVKTPFLHRIPPHVTQTFLRVSHDTRAEMLLKIAKRSYKCKEPTVIFSNSASCSDWVSIFLRQNDISCVNVNANMPRATRVDQYQSFRDADVEIISCTDLVSRGLDTVRARHVVNFEFPHYMADYIHRCGRTGRVGGHENCRVTNMVFKDVEVKLTQQIEYAVRKIQDLHNVNANIKRIINAQTERALQKKLAREELKELRAD